MFVVSEPSPVKDYNRFVLGPGEEIVKKIYFLPCELKEFNEKIVLEIAGWRKNYIINCVACCDIPRVDTDPSVMFSQVSLYVTVEFKYLWHNYGQPFLTQRPLCEIYI